MVDSVRPLRNAASLILVRGEPLEVLMVRRHARASFASSYVFPGGVVEPDDADDAWLPRLIGADTLSRPERAARIAACRETFEETQILVAVDPQSGVTTGRHTWHGMSFFDGLSASGLYLDLSRLIPFVHWIMPDGVPRRFDTRFYITTAPPEQDGASDGVEITDLNWTEPAIGVEEALTGSRHLYFPTLANLELLS
ncbi:NUDIX hydrolase [Sphingobium sp. YR768]|uniref:NUDIX hydrolase n=1 Tax=Sphingobium sp. YR768 TaxID=1884365 RepID=UPI0008BBB550|nr:NUDIX hydrolase [Sphingobium sp. YR768]SES15195.1 NUDIX domain-containing protein [Sphingobium sp. YR768]